MDYKRLSCSHRPFPAKKFKLLRPLMNQGGKGEKGVGGNVTFPVICLTWNVQSVAGRQAENVELFLITTPVNQPTLDEGGKDT